MRRRKYGKRRITGRRSFRRKGVYRMRRSRRRSMVQRLRRPGKIGYRL